VLNPERLPRKLPTLISQFTQFFNVAAEQGLLRSLASRSISVRAWRMWVMVVLGLLLGDHLGMWELHELFANNTIDIHEIGVIVAGLGALFSSIPNKNGS
jgi:hypothetical protein